MNATYFLILIFTLALIAFWMGRARSVALAGVGGTRSLNSLPFYYGALTAFWCALPSLLVLVLWWMFGDHWIQSQVKTLISPEYLASQGGNMSLVMNQVHNLASGIMTSGEMDPSVLAAAAEVKHLLGLGKWSAFAFSLAMGILGALWIWIKISPQFNARVRVEAVFKWVLFSCALVAVLTTLGIVASVLFEALRFFEKVPVSDFIFGLEWSPQTAIRADQQGSSGRFGAIPLLAGTLMIAFIALSIAVPLGLMIAIYLVEYAKASTRAWVKPLLEVLAGIPTVVYGFFAALTVAPLIRDLGLNLGLDNWMVISSESALAAGLVMGIMIIPFVSSLSDDVINAVPRSLRDGALGLGSTQSEMIRNVVIPAALPGIVGSVLLATSRAIGETMIVVMAAGLAANLTANPFDALTTVTVQIVTLLVGDQEFDSAKTLAAFALGLLLFVMTLGINYFALYIVRKYREQYD